MFDVNYQISVKKKHVKNLLCKIVPPPPQTKPPSYMQCKNEIRIFLYRAES